MNNKALITELGFKPKEGTTGIYHKHYSKVGNYALEVDFENSSFNYGELITAESKTTQNFSQAENWVVFECVDRLLEKGYQPQNITLEKTWPSGHGTSGRLDILVTNEDGKSYLMIECKTAGAEFTKEYKKMLKDGGQLFSYYQMDRDADFIMLYASQLSAGSVTYQNEIIKIEDDYRQTANVKEFYEIWNKLPKNNGIFDSWTTPYHFVSKALTPESLIEITQEDSGKIFNRFLEILRHNVVSDKPNAFNKIFTLFLCKIYDESQTLPGKELSFQWVEGIDDNISFQKRLTDLYGKGMSAFLDKKVTDFSEADFDEKFGNTFNDPQKKELLNEFTRIRLMKNNEFAIKEVFDQYSFTDNGKVVKEVVELLQNYKIRYTKKQQYLSDFFELLLTTGLKQESGQFFTPVPIAQFIIRSLPVDKIILEKLEAGEKDNLLPTMIDYAAGSGHFLTESMHVMQGVINNIDETTYIRDTAKKINTWKSDHFEWAKVYVYGIEKDYRLVKVGKVGCYLHGDGIANVVHSDGLGNFTNTKEYTGRLKLSDNSNKQDNRQFDIVISNPPYSVSAFRNNARKYYGENDFELYNHLTDQSSEIECLFIERTKQLLKDGGVAGIILPSSILSNTGIYTKTREIILRYFEIIAITELGSNTFMATGTNTVTLFLRRRKNRFAKDIENSVNTFATNIQDVTINRIETPVAKYVSQAWGGISFDDYRTIFQKAPNKIVKSHYIYKEWVKKVTTKNINAVLTEIINSEKEKLLYFILAYSQQVVLVKSGEKKAEKAFLGYEFSNRRGSEGIHPMQRGKSIDECTKLYDPDQFENPEKASTYIYDAFSGDFSRKIDDSLKENVRRVYLMDMMTFDRVDFDKSVSLSVKKKVKIESQWEVSTIGQVADTQYGYTDKATSNGKFRYLRITDLNNNGSIKTDNEAVFISPPKEEVVNQFLLKDNDIVIARSGSVGKSALYKTKSYEPMIFASYLIRLVVNIEKILPQYLFIFTQTSAYWEQVKANSITVTQPNLNAEKIKAFQIPLPPKYIQEKIVTEIAAIEAQEKKAKTGVKDSQYQIVSAVMEDIGTLKTLAEICNMKAGKFVSAQDINDQEGKGLYPCYGGNGLRGYTKTLTHEGRFPLIGRQGALCGNVGIVDGKFHATEHAVVVTPAQNVDISWLYYKLREANLNQYATGVAQPGLSVQNLNKVIIQTPSFTEQQHIVKKIEKLESEIAKLEAEISLIPQQKEAILKKYL